jgi:hypothetical protein
MNNRISLVALLACYLVMSFTAFFYYPKWQKQGAEATLSWDVNGYYAFLPAIFIYKDLKKLAFRDSIMQKYNPSIGNYAEGNLDTTTGNYLLRYTCGQAVVMSPWFFMAHAYASSGKTYAADGYSKPYQVFIGVGMFLLALLGLYYLRMVLLFYYKDVVTAITLVAIVIGSNYLNYASIDQAMTHSTLFTLYCLLLYNTIMYYKEFQTKNIVGIGILIGLITLIRPPDIISVLLPMLWGVNNIQQAKERFYFLHVQWKHVLTILLCIGICVLPQLAYGYFATGHVIYNGYKGFGFDFLKPHCLDYCFSAGSGWLLYTPMMLFSIIGLFVFIKHKQNVWALLLFCVINFYLVSAWQVWWYGGRAMIQSYPALSFFIASLISVVHTKRMRTFIFYPIFLLFVYLNIWCTVQLHTGAIKIAGTSWAYYKATVGRWRVAKDTYKLIDNRHALIEKGKNEKCFFEHQYITDTNKYFVLNTNNEFGTEIKLSALPSSTESIFVDALITCSDIETVDWRMPQFGLKYFANGKVIQNAIYRIGRDVMPNTQQTITVKSKLPHRNVDSIIVAFWTAGSQVETKVHSIKCYSYQ